MSGKNYKISYCQVQRQLQLSILLNFFSIKERSDNTYLKEYLRSFSEDENKEVQLEYNLAFVLMK